ncbi:MAG: hypothetical protein MJ214_03275 [Bacilli bacterium]|nr:hypothetical protein [Bacilli bacterium]
MPTKFKTLLLFTSTFVLTSCGSQKQPDWNLYTITANAPQYKIQGIEKKYQANTEVNLLIKPINSSILLPSTEDVILYGGNDYTYNPETGELSFIINQDIRLDVISKSVYGEAITRDEAAIWLNAHYNPKEHFTWTTETITWDLPGVKFPDSEITNLFKEITTIEITTNNGEFKITNDTHEEIEREISLDLLDKNIAYYYLNDSQLTLCVNVPPSKFRPATGSFCAYMTFNEKMVTNSAYMYFDNYLPASEEYHPKSEINGVFHYTIDPILKEAK